MFLVRFMSVSVWKGLIQHSWFRRERKASQDHPGHSHLQMFCSATLSVCAIEKWAATSKTSCSVWPDCEKAQPNGLWDTYRQKFAEIWCKKAGQVWIHAWNESVKISWVSVNMADNNYQSSSDKPVFSVNSLHNKKILVDLRVFYFYSIVINIVLKACQKGGLWSSQHWEFGCSHDKHFVITPHHLHYCCWIWPHCIYNVVSHSLFL